MNTNLQIPANKNRHFFCHSLRSHPSPFGSSPLAGERGNPVATLAVLAVFLFGMFVAPIYQANALTREQCLDGTSQFEAEPECLEYLRQEKAEGSQISTISGLIFRINGYLNLIVPFLVGIAVFIVIWGIFGYISHSAEEEKRQEARQFILWGVIFIFLMLSVWGLVNVLNNSFNLKKTPIDVPSVFPTTNN